MGDPISDASNSDAGGFGFGGKGRYSNPFYGVPMEYLPVGIEQQLYWANHFLFRFPFYRTVLSRVANWFITSLTVECDDADAKEKYENIFKDMEWKQVLSKAGLDLLAYGNAFATIAQGFDRFLKCENPGCGRITNIEKIKKYEFTNKGTYKCVCKACQVNGIHTVIDKASSNLSRMEVIFWNPREIKVRYDRTTNCSEYFWEIPKDYATLVTKPNNKFHSKKTPKAVYDAIYNERPMVFNGNNFIHLKIPTPSGIPNEGKSTPYCIYLFDDFFMLKVLERYNQTLLFEDIVPFRVFSMATQSNTNPQQNMLLMQNAGQWKSNVEDMVRQHRRDPGSYHTFPFQFQYEHLGGDGKQLAPTELIQNTIGNILNALNIPQELYTMTLQTQAMGPALRLFENSWSFMIDFYNNLLQEWADIVSKIEGLPKAKISIVPVTMSDDVERKAIIGQLVSSNSLARSELLKLYNFDFKSQLRAKMQEDEITQELQQEQQLKQQVQQMSQTGGQGGGPQQQGGDTPGDVMGKAKEIAQQLFPMSGSERRTQLQQIKASNETLYSAVKTQLDQMTSSAKSQGVQQARQSQQQGQGQQ